MINPFTLVHSDICRASSNTIFIDSQAPSPEANPLTQNLPVLNREQYFAASGVIQMSQPVLIKFTSFGNTNMASFAGGQALHEWVQVNSCVVLNGEELALVNPNTEDENWFSSGNTLGEHSQVTAQIMIATEAQGEEFSAMPYIDIIGAPQKIADTFPKGVIGQYNSNHIPNGTNTTFALNQQALAEGPEFCAYKQNEQWLDATSGMNLNIYANTISNADILQTNTVALYFYDA
ncbi:hypothetical protein PSECIP111951_01146 [Pseudoalteromonas holothuriae]|uniref:Uncharacterized protein n=1 Tax=Pseudoalteromonas holothuriae TaxID=2963714 RepID=A0ABM9GI13_9GAMM|nr:hypothetical protein [Pseudoalteromonas sp. CIP111951]CAH9054967.1 hypothetical protein PSECIP111951_01146 [Pseudoalteromonas sp. CIP111951]